MIDEFQTLTKYRLEVLDILYQSKMPIDTIQEFTTSLRDLICVSMDITSVAFELNENEKMALFILMIIKSLEEKNA